MPLSDSGLPSNSTSSATNRTPERTASGFRRPFLSQLSRLGGRNHSEHQLQQQQWIMQEPNQQPTSTTRTTTSSDPSTVVAPGKTTTTMSTTTVTTTTWAPLGSAAQASSVVSSGVGLAADVSTSDHDSRKPPPGTTARTSPLNASSAAAAAGTGASAAPGASGSASGSNFLNDPQSFLKQPPSKFQARSQNSIPAPIADIDQAQAELREKMGQCPTCGQQLFKLHHKKKGVMASLFGVRSGSIGGNAGQGQSERRRSEGGGASSSTGAGGQLGPVVKKSPLTIEGQVLRGQCLKCSLQQHPLVNHHAEAQGHSESATGHTAASTSTNVSMNNYFPGQNDQLAAGSGTDHAFVVAASNPNARSIVLVQDLYSVGDYAEDGQNYFGALGTGPNMESRAPPGTAVYQGSYNDYGERNGQGEMTWSNGDRYVGEFFNGVRHGHGTLYFADGSEYVGSWECNYMHGSGTRRFPNGDMYMGSYVDGKRSGQGRFYFANGDMYIGNWKDDCISGFGRYYYSSGLRFEGNFQSGKRHGKGKVQRVDGGLDIYRYVNDQRSGVGVRWSPDRTKAWMIENGRIKKKLSIAEAVSLVYEIENVMDGSNIHTTNA